MNTSDDELRKALNRAVSKGREKTGEAAVATYPFWAVCAKCRHNWIAGYYPMEVGAFAEMVLQNSTCEKCGGDALVARQESGTLLKDVGEAEG